MNRRMTCSNYFMILAVVAALAVAGLVVPAGAQVTPPDLSVCDGVDACEASRSFCDAGGFTITLTNYTPAPSDNSGAASYTYTICAPANDGICSNIGGSCQDHGDCNSGVQCKENKPSTTPPTFACQNGSKNGQSCETDSDCYDNSCEGGSSQCRVDQFQGLSHSDVVFPTLGETCLSAETQVTVSCHSPARGSYAGVLGDGSCFESDSPVAKCESPNLAAGECLTMTISIAGELNKPGLGAAITVDKPGNECEASCLAGPSCEPCEDDQGDDGACLTRTLGFWGTHPHIAQYYDEVTVCGNKINGQNAGECSTSEALCSSNLDYKPNSPYLQLIAQLTAAKLNLNATALLAESATCSDFRFNSESIEQILARCDTAAICNGSKKTISDSGCIEALNAFNNSEDTGFDQTPDPFDKPGPANVVECQEARGNGLAIGKSVALACAP